MSLRGRQKGMDPEGTDPLRKRHMESMDITVLFNLLELKIIVETVIGRYTGTCPVTWKYLEL